MLTDLAASPLASYRPPIEAEADSLRDFLAETFANFRGDLPLTRQAFSALCLRLVDEAMREAGAAALSGDLTEPADTRQTMVELLRLISASDEGGLGMRAVCFLRLLGKDERSFQQIADDYGFTSRASPHAAYRALQQRTGLRARGDKSDSAREACRRRRTGQRRETRPWAGQTIWAASTRTLLPASHA